MIDRRLSIGMFILGILGHYDDDEVLANKHIQYVAQTLRKKHFDIKNGTAKDRFNATNGRITPQQRIGAIKRLQQASENWLKHSAVADKAWVTASKATAQTEITITGFISAILKKEPDTIKWYGFNTKKLEKFKNESQFGDDYMFRNMRASTKLLSFLDAEIAHYNYNNRSVA